MADKIKELEKKLAKARKEEAKKAGFTVVIFEDDMETLTEIKAAVHDLTEKEKADIMNAASNLSSNIDEIKEIAASLDQTVGTWLKFMALIDDPLKEIIAVMFGLNSANVATLPNIDLLALVFQDNPWIDTKAKSLASELDYISKKNK